METDRTNVVVLHALALQLMHVVGARLEVNAVTAIVAVLVDCDGASPGLALELAARSGAAEISRIGGNELPSPGVMSEAAAAAMAQIARAITQLSCCS